VTPVDVWCHVPKKSEEREGAERSPSDRTEPDATNSDADEADDADDAAAARQRARERAGDDDLPRKAGRTNSGPGAR
jgi:hypothetical protein